MNRFPMTDPLITSLPRRALMKLGAAGMLGASSLLALRPAHAADYKALVCVYLFGGNDGLNMVVPTDTARYAAYASVRNRIALPQASLLPLTGVDFGLHPAMVSLTGLWQSGQLAPVFNVGPLVQPIDKALYLAAAERTGVLPDQLFSHADQQTLWDTATGSSTTRAGWGGRAAEALATTLPVISVAGTSRFGSSSKTAPVVVPNPGTDFVASGFDGASAVGRARQEAVDALLAQPRDSQLAQVYGFTQRRALDMSARLGPLVRTLPGEPGAVAAIDAAFAPLIEKGQIKTSLGKQLYQVAKLVAGRETVGGNRQIFFASQGGYDLHRLAQVAGGSPLEGRHAPLLAELSDALVAFHAAMQALGLGDAVTSFTQTEFGRTFVPNRNDGTDHGWGNTQLVSGGAVKGRTTYGHYPDLVLGGESDVAAGSDGALGRWIPTSSVDQYAATLLGWFGASDAQLDGVLPNLRNFGEARTLGFL